MMKCPAIGDRVSYPGGLAVGPCTGTVHAIYPTDQWEWDDADCDEGRPIGRAPESEWSVGVTVDELPPLWAYHGSNKFAAEVKTLTLIESAK